MYYSKNFPSKHGETVIIPENYSGNAFRSNGEPETFAIDTEITEDGQKEIQEENVSVYTSGGDENADKSEDAAPTFSDSHQHDRRGGECDDFEKSRKNPFLSFLLPPKSQNSSFSFLHDIDMEDIIIIVLLFLMYQSDTDDDIALLLLLLLFLK